MRYSNDQSLGAAIKEFLQAYRLDERMNQAKLIHSWEKVVGIMIARHTKDLHIRNGKLFVKIDSPALKNELTYSTSVIIERLNKEAGGKVIEEIIFS